MAAVDISLNELAITLELLSMASGGPVDVFEYGIPNNPTEVLARLFPASHKGVSAFGFPTVFASPYLSPLSVVSIGLFGEPNAFVPAPAAATVTGILPAPGSIMSSGTPWQADIGGVLAELLIWVGYSDLNVVEMAYDGSGYCPNFSGSSTLTVIAPGVTRVVVRRGGGWPSSPKFLVRARTVNGGINV